jgi:hypothetical protein
MDSFFRFRGNFWIVYSRSALSFVWDLSFPRHSFTSLHRIQAIHTFHLRHSFFTFVLDTFESQDDLRHILHSVILAAQGEAGSPPRISFQGMFISFLLNVSSLILTIWYRYCKKQHSDQSMPTRHHCHPRCRNRCEYCQRVLAGQSWLAISTWEKIPRINLRLQLSLRSKLGLSL